MKNEETSQSTAYFCYPARFAKLANLEIVQVAKPHVLNFHCFFCINSQKVCMVYNLLLSNSHVLISPEYLQQQQQLISE